MANKKLFHAPVLASEILAHLVTEKTAIFLMVLWGSADTLNLSCRKRHS